MDPKIRTWGNWASYSLALGAGTVGVVWPDQPWIGRVILCISLTIFVGISAWFLVSRRRTKTRGKRRNHELIGNIASICFVGLAVSIGWLLFSADARYGASIRLAMGARVEFPSPNWSKNADGTWNADTVIRISGKFVRTGVVIGITARDLKNVEVGAPYGQCCLPSPYKGFENLGTQRLYIAEPRADYVLHFTASDQHVTFRFRFEGESEGPTVTW